MSLAREITLITTRTVLAALLEDGGGRLYSDPREITLITTRVVLAALAGGWRRKAILRPVASELVSFNV